MEGFGDYLRVDPQLNIYACYLRKDLGFNFAELEGLPAKQLKINFLEKLVGMAKSEGIAKLIQETSALRFTVSPFCNFNCRMPDTSSSWCMEMVDSNYVYPPLKLPKKKALTKVRIKVI